MSNNIEGEIIDMKEIKLGLIGAGYAAGKHLEVINAIKDVKACGITSRTKTKADILANKYNIDTCAKNLDNLVKESKPDALMVLVTEDQMYNVGVKALSYGLPVFFEKPSGLLPEENWRLAELARKNSIPTMVSFNRRYYSIFHKGMKIIRNHGPLMGVVVEGHERMWRIREGGKFSEDIMEKWIFANSTHTIDLLRFFGGEVVDVKSIVHRYRESRGDQFASVMELESGAIGQYSAHWYSPGGWRVVLYGDGVTVEFKPLESGCWIDKKFEVHKIEPDEVDLKYKPGFFKQMEAFVRLVKDKKSKWPMLDLGGSYKTMFLAQEMCSNVIDKSLALKK